MTDGQRIIIMATALEDIVMEGMRRRTLSTEAELTSLILKMESIAGIALRKLEGRLPL